MGNRIAWLRIKKGLTQEALGKKLGLSASAIGMYEQGRREPSISILISLANEFGVTTDYLLTGRNGKAPLFASMPELARRLAILYAAWLSENDEER